MKEISIRKVIVLPTLMHWRREVIENVFGTVPFRELMAANRRYYERHIPDGSHIAVVAEADGVDAGCGGICLTEELPSPDNPSGRCAYLMNIYVKREYRARGTLEARDRSTRPGIANKVRNFERYDTIYLGFPIWWYTAPTIVNTFLESYNTDGKVIIPFATSGGSTYGELDPFP